MSMNAERLQAPKRTHSEMEHGLIIHYPQRPIIDSYENVVAFSAASQRALESFYKSLSDGDRILRLPFISVHALQSQRFSHSEDSITLLKRSFYEDFRTKALSRSEIDCNGLYVRGPIGIGKCYMLYWLASDLRSRQNESYRVTYINDCEFWSSKKYEFILNELATTFFDDTIDGKSMVEWCKYVEAGDNENLLRHMMKAIINYVAKKPLKMVVHL